MVAVTGLEGITGKLASVEKKLRKKILVKAITNAAKKAKWAARAAVREDTGVLKKSLGEKVKSYQGGNVAVGIVGPRSSFKMVKTKTASGTIKTKTATGIGKLVRRGGRKEQFAWPSKYAHLVEKGTRRSRAFPFLGPSSQAVSASISADVASDIADGVEAAAK